MTCVAGDKVRVHWAGRTWAGEVYATSANPDYVHVEVTFGGADDPVPLFVHTDLVVAP